VPVDHPTTGARKRLRDRASKIAPHHLRFFSKKPKAILRHKEGERHFLSGSAHYLPGSLRRVSRNAEEPAELKIIGPEE
jgi:hypothetical protein